MASNGPAASKANLEDQLEADKLPQLFPDSIPKGQTMPGETVSVDPKQALTSSEEVIESLKERNAGEIPDEGEKEISGDIPASTEDLNKEKMEHASVKLVKANDGKWEIMSPKKKWVEKQDRASEREQETQEASKKKRKSDEYAKGMDSVRNYDESDSLKQTDKEVLGEGEQITETHNRKRTRNHVAPSDMQKSPSGDENQQESEMNAQSTMENVEASRASKHRKKDSEKETEKDVSEVSSGLSDQNDDVSLEQGKPMEENEKENENELHAAEEVQKETEEDVADKRAENKEVKCGDIDGTDRETENLSQAGSDLSSPSKRRNSPRARERSSRTPVPSARASSRQGRSSTSNSDSETPSETVTSNTEAIDLAAENTVEEQNHKEKQKGGGRVKLVRTPPKRHIISTESSEISGTLNSDDQLSTTDDSQVKESSNLESPRHLSRCSKTAAESPTKDDPIEEEINKSDPAEKGGESGEDLGHNADQEPKQSKQKGTARRGRAASKGSKSPTSDTDLCMEAGREQQRKAPSESEENVAVDSESASNDKVESPKQKSSPKAARSMSRRNKSAKSSDSDEPDVGHERTPPDEEVLLEAEENVEKTVDNCTEALKKSPVAKSQKQKSPARPTRTPPKRKKSSEADSEFEESEKTPPNEEVVLEAEENMVETDDMEALEKKSPIAKSQKQKSPARPTRTLPKRNKSSEADSEPEESVKEQETSTPSEDSIVKESEKSPARPTRTLRKKNTSEAANESDESHEADTNKLEPSAESNVGDIEEAENQQVGTQKQKSPARPRRTSCKENMEATSNSEESSKKSDKSIPSQEEAVVEDTESVEKTDQDQNFEQPKKKGPSRQLRTPPKKKKVPTATLR